MRRRKIPVPRPKRIPSQSPARASSIRLPGRRILLLVSLACLASAAALLASQWSAFASAPGRLPWGLTLGGVPVGGLTPEQAASQVEARYLAPVDLTYGQTPILLLPESVQFQVDVAAMLSAASEDQSPPNPLSDFWQFLWRRGEARSELRVPLQATYSEGALRQVLADISSRYDQPPTPAVPGLGDLFIYPGQGGHVLDIESSLPAVEAALMDLENRGATLVVVDSAPPTASLETLGAVVQQYALVRPFQGLLAVTLVDLQSGEEIRLNLLDGERIRTEPDIAVAATSAVKALIITEFFRERPDGLFPWEVVEIEHIVASSSNTSADNLMYWIGDGCWQCAFQTITETGRRIGMPNTFVGGIYFAEGAYEFQLEPPGILTPSNQRTDFTTHPDPYFQTTPSDLARLYTALYHCGQDAGGLLELFPGEFSPEQCEEIIDWLSQVVDPLILKRGLPDGTRIAHKHGFTDWLEGASGPDTVGDAGIVFSPGGDYVLSVFAYRAENPSWEEFTSVIGDVSRAAYNYFNPPEPIR